MTRQVLAKFQEDLMNNNTKSYRVYFGAEEATITVAAEPVPAGRVRTTLVVDGVERMIYSGLSALLELAELWRNPAFQDMFSALTVEGLPDEIHSADDELELLRFYGCSYYFCHTSQWAQICSIDMMAVNIGILPFWDTEEPSSLLLYVRRSSTELPLAQRRMSLKEAEVLIQRLREQGLGDEVELSGWREPFNLAVKTRDEFVLVVDGEELVNGETRIFAPKQIKRQIRRVKIPVNAEATAKIREITLAYSDEIAAQENARLLKVWGIFFGDGDYDVATVADEVYAYAASHCFLDPPAGYFEIARLSQPYRVVVGRIPADGKLRCPQHLIGLVIGKKQWRIEELRKRLRMPNLRVVLV